MSTSPVPTSDGDDVSSVSCDDYAAYQKSAEFRYKNQGEVEFHDNESPCFVDTYVPVGFGDSVHLPNGRNILTIPVKGAARNLKAGYRVVYAERH